MASFRQASLESGPFGPELRTLPTGQPRPLTLKEIVIRNWFVDIWNSKAKNKIFFNAFFFFFDRLLYLRYSDLL